MAQNLVVNGVTFLCPQQGDQNWAGANGADGWMAAVTVGMLQKAGGAFTLTADVNFGSSFGLVSPYFKSASANIAGAGAVRLANADSISFRNVGNSGDLALTPAADGILNYNGVALATISATQTLTNKTISGASNTLSNIAYSSLTLTGSVVNADIASAAAIAYSKLNLVGSVVNADIATGAAIAYSKLNLTGSVANGDLAGGITVAKGGTGLASATAYAVLCGGTTSTGAFQPVAALGTAGWCLTSNGAGALPTFQAVTPTFSGLTANGVAYASSTSAIATAAAGTSGQVMTSNGSGSAPTMQTLPGNTTALKIPTIQKFTTGSGTYTTPSSPTPLYIKVRLVGGGGGGQGSGTTPGSGGTGGTTTFGTTLLSASGGTGGVGDGGSGGAASLGTGPVGIALTGGGGGAAGNTTVGTVALGGAPGGSSALGGGGHGGNQGGGGGAAGSANTGGGGGGGGIGGGAGIGGSGGGSGGFVDAIITSPAATYSYAVGSGGTAGTAGTSGAGGGAGGSGVIIVEEHYQ